MPSASSTCSAGCGSRHLVLVGEMVPPMLVPAASIRHLGSADIDFCISVAMTDGATRQCAASVQQLIAPYFEPASSAGHRWRKRPDASGLPLIVDFLAAKTEETAVSPDGSIDVLGIPDGVDHPGVGDPDAQEARVADEWSSLVTP